ncbi:MAG TPA: glycosyltransferase [Vicinamibacterales bacterium]|nr:glycosyltransferase [Vicinamibacterales bacterium]
MITGLDILCLSTQDWNDVWTRKQRFMRRLAAQGNRVLYVETQLSLASVGRLRTDKWRPFRWLRGPREIEPNLFIGTLPLVLPGFQMWPAVNSVNNFGLRLLLRQWLRALGFEAPILWTYNPYSENLVGTLGERFAIYECVDELTASRGLVRSEVVRAQEARLLSKVRAAIVTHDNLYRSKRNAVREIHLIPNGAEIEHLRRVVDDPSLTVPTDMASLPRPVVGFLGSVMYWLDFDLLRSLALARPQWSFAFVGPVGRLADLHKIRLPNVHLLGRKPYEDVPAYVKGFDVCLNPYLMDETAANCSPLKLYEYLASGRPVVSTDMPEARKFEDVVGIGETHAEILQRLEEALRPEAKSPEAVARRLAVALPHSWDQRFARAEQVLATLA